MVESPFPTQTPKALIIISDLEFGGAQRQVVELCNNMAASRFEMHLCVLSDYIPLADNLIEFDERLHIIRRKSKWDFSVVTRLKNLVQEINASIVHSYLFDATIASRIAGRLAGSAIAVIDSERNAFNFFKKRQYIAFWLTKRCCDLTIANSTAGADFNSKALGMPRNEYEVIHNGVDTQKFTPRDNVEIRKGIGIRPDELVIGMFASFKPQKNHPLLLDAARKVIDLHNNVRFVFVGDELHEGGSGSTDYKKDILNQMKQLQIEDHCLLLGNREDVEQLYCACDFTVLPSLYEGTPNVALESMASGAPVVASNVSDNAYVIPDGKVGYIVPLNDEVALVEKICLLLDSVELRKTLSEQAREWTVSEFSCSRLAEKTADAYQKVLQTKLNSKTVS